ncbi:MAG TPA: biotin/lipoyl-binding protein, partial [Terracidiphilus sp.]
MTNDSNPQSQGPRPPGQPPATNGGSRQNSRSSQDHESAPEHKAVSGRGAVVGVAIVLIAIVALAIYGIWKRHHNDEVLADTTQRLSAPSVIAIPPRPGAPVDTFVLPGNVGAYTDSPIYARTSGYLSKWYFDIGARVKKGALLAEIAAPEVDQQLAQAEADLITAQTNAGNAKTQADRYKGLVGSDAVSQQDTDTFVTQAAST